VCDGPLLPAQYVKAYIKRNKHDAADAEAICEAVGRPTMWFVPVKTAERQASQLLHHGREQLVGTSGGVRNGGGVGLAQCGRLELLLIAGAYIMPPRRLMGFTARATVQ
jgi:transposase